MWNVTAVRLDDKLSERNFRRNRLHEGIDLASGIFVVERRAQNVEQHIHAPPRHFLLLVARQVLSVVVVLPNAKNEFALDLA